MLATCSTCFPSDWMYTPYYSDCLVQQMCTAHDSDIPNTCLCYRPCRRWLGSGPERPIDREIQDKFQGRPHHGHVSLDRALRASDDSAGGGRLALYAYKISCSAARFTARYHHLLSSPPQTFLLFLLLLLLLLFWHRPNCNRYANFDNGKKVSCGDSNRNID